eukprot:6173540-Pleurochrysis_carterae.AAC.2
MQTMREIKPGLSQRGESTEKLAHVISTFRREACARALAQTRMRARRVCVHGQSCARARPYA